MSDKFQVRHTCDMLYSLLLLTDHIPNLPLDVRSDCASLIAKLSDYVSDGYSLRISENDNGDIDIGYSNP